MANVNGKSAFRVAALAVLAVLCRVGLAEPPRAVDGRRLAAALDEAARSAGPASSCVRVSDVIYGRKDGMVLTMDVDAEVIIKKGAGHGWGNQGEDMVRLADWYGRHLAPDSK